MGIEWFRDLAIVILGFGVTAVVISIGILAFMLYYKLNNQLFEAAAKSVDQPDRHDGRMDLVLVDERGRQAS